MKRKSNRRKSSSNTENITQGILKLLKSEPSQSFNYKQIAAKFGVDDPSSRNQIIKKLAQLAAKKQITEESTGKFKIIPNINTYSGVLQVTSKGTGYVIVEELGEDIFVPKNALNRALDKDEVEVYVINRRRRGKSEGEITRIISRKTEKFVGVIDIQKTYAFVMVQNAKMYTDIFIPKDKIGDAENGDKVVVKLEDWPEKADSPFGTILQVLGKPGDHDTEIHSILAQYGLPYEFPEEVQQYADGLDTSIQESEIKKRRDMRNILTFTVDPKDAKDFDDALSFEVLENGNYEIGIHIADVSHYVQPGTILDTEAYERATSVYLVDRVVPMLPEVLSNNVCSLRPLEEKYTFSAVFELNAKAEIKNQWFGRTVTYSDARFAYEEAQHIIETEETAIPAEISLTGKAYQVDQKIADAVLKMDELAKILRGKRMRDGAISFDKVEVKFNLNEANEPIGVFFKTSKDANKLIEEFMLLANKKVAEFVGKQDKKQTYIYRIHDEPNDEKLSALQNVIGRFGYTLDLRDRKSITSSLNGLLKDVQGKKEQNMVDTLAIRTMSKAEYSTQNIGHYGLAFEYYSHFTSPIRRYPDVIAHRLLQHYLDKGKDTKFSVSKEEYEEKCKHSSNMEGLASSAERDSIKFMQIKFMKDHENEEFLGVISGVTEWGIYVEIVSNKCEGMIRLKDISDDHYIFDQDEYAIIGQRTKKVYQLGDEVHVKVKNADLIKRHLDFTLIVNTQSV